jgi:hypothetical protein
MSRQTMPLVAVVVWVLATCAGCAGVGLSDGELDLLDASTADARFMDRTWPARSEAERLEFVHENALRWQYFGDLAHGRRPSPPVGEKGADR